MTFYENPLQKLYPNLKFNTHSTVRSVSQPPMKTAIKEAKSSDKVEIVQTETPPVQTEQKKVEVIEKVAEIPKKSVKVKEPEPEVSESEKVEEPKQIPKPRPKPKPKPKAVRENVLPVKGEQGLQKRYTIEQRKQMYLDKIARKSVKNAEREVQKVNEVLESVQHSGDRLKEEEKTIKTRLKLINYAKYFIEDTKEKTDNIDAEENIVPDMQSKPERSKVLSSGRTNSTSATSIRRRGSGIRSRPAEWYVDEGVSSGTSEGG